jgi:nitrate reductase gamma subunit
MYVGGSIIGSILVIALMAYLMRRAYTNTRPYDSRRNDE